MKIYEFHYVFFEYNDFDIHEVPFVIPFENNLDCKLSFGGINVLVILSNITRIKLIFHLLLFVNHFH